MATKAEQNNDYQQYDAAVHRANTALATGNAIDAVRQALTALGAIEGAAAFAKRYLKLDPFHHPAHEILFSIVPMLFDIASLDIIENHLDGNRKLERTSDYPFRQRLAEARQRLQDCTKLWDSLPLMINKANAMAGQSLAFWSHIGAVSQDGVIFKRSWNPNEPSRGKCPYCGAVSGGRKLSFCRERECLKCGALAFLVILTPSDA